MKLLLTIAALATFPLAAMAEPPASTPDKPYRIVFEVTSKDPERWMGALRNIRNAKEALGKDTQIVVVTHGGGLKMLLAASSAADPEFKATLEKLHQDGVTFDACENTMKHDHVEKKDLSDTATPVDSGVAEVVRKQTEGYSYINIGS